MSYLRNFLILALFFIPIHSFSDEKIEQSKFFVENLGKQVIEKVSNVNLSENERLVNFRSLYLDSFDNKNDINFDTSLPSSKPLELHDFLYLFINLEG